MGEWEDQQKLGKEPIANYLDHYYGIRVENVSSKIARKYFFKSIAFALVFSAFNNIKDKYIFSTKYLKIRANISKNISGSWSFPPPPSSYAHISLVFSLMSVLIAWVMWFIIVGNSLGSYSWVILFALSRGSFSLVKLKGHSCGSNSLVKLVGHSRMSISWVKLVD